MTFARQALGLDGEDTACRALEARGYRILSRRYRTRIGEIDVVARQGACIVFVEVKTRRDGRFGDPAAAVTAEKQRRLAVMAADYLARHRLERAPARFDVVAIMLADGRPTVEVIVDAFRPGW
ncbi:MAG: YraN family protein [Vicinamibacterales bacterium]